MEDVIKVSNLTKQFSGHTVVDHLSFSVKRGEVFGLLGPNGAGKSTTIDCILGLKRPTEGEVSIFGLTPAKNRKKVFEQVGVQLQASNYQAQIKVGELCEERAALYSHPADYRDLLETFGLESFTHRLVAELSGGERQKLSVLLTLICNPKVLFLDELTTGLDTEARHEIWDILQSLKKRNVTIFLTSHYMDEVEVLCDKIVIIKEGRKLLQGDVDTLVKNSPYSRLEEAYLYYIHPEKKQEAIL